MYSDLNADGYLIQKY